MHGYHRTETTSDEAPLSGEQMWSVFDFARRFRLVKSEEDRLLALCGPVASFRDLLANAQRQSLTS